MLQYDMESICTDFRRTISTSPITSKRIKERIVCVKKLNYYIMIGMLSSKNKSCLRSMSMRKEQSDPHNNFESGFDNTINPVCLALWAENCEPCSRVPTDRFTHIIPVRSEYTVSFRKCFPYIVGLFHTGDVDTTRSDFDWYRNVYLLTPAVLPTPLAKELKYGRVIGEWR